MVGIVRDCWSLVDCEVLGLNFHLVSTSQI